MAPRSGKSKHIAEVKRLYIEELHSLSEISKILGPSVQTLSRWLGEEGIELAARPRDPNAGRSAAEQTAINERISATQRARVAAGEHRGGRSRSIERETRKCGNPACVAEFEARVDSKQRFCTRTCAQIVTAKAQWEGKRRMTTCPCGKEFYSPYMKKYCSDECRGIYAEKRQPDPANYTQFTCLRPACGKVVVIRKSYASAKKYCSNECSARHNRTKQHIVIEDALVLDSPYEALFYGLMRLWKIPVERADREQAIEIGDGWYCPDFWLPELGLWVEVKGFEDDDDRARYAAWRAASHALLVLGRDELHEVRSVDRPDYCTNKLIMIADRQRREAAHEMMDPAERQVRLYATKS